MAQTTGTTTPDLTSVLTTWLNKKFVRDLEFVLQHQKFTEKAVIPEGAGNVGRFLTFAPPSKAKSYSGDGGGDGTASITEGSTTANEITGVKQTSTNITIAEFGEFTKVGQLYEYAAVAGVRQKLLKRLKDGAYYSLDTYVRKQSVTSTNILYASADTIGAKTTNTGLPTTLGAACLMLARKTLLDAQAMGFEGLEGHPDGHYAAVITPKQELDIITEYTTLRITWSQGVTNVVGPDAQQKWVNGYIGSIYAVATYVTNNYTTSTPSASTACDIGFVYADGGVGAMAFQDMNPQIIINDINSPYKNINTFAWHSMFGAGLIDTNRVVKIYSAS